MKKSQFTDSRIVQALKEHEAGRNVDDICRQPGFNRNTLYNRKKKLSGMDSELLRKYKELERENSHMKKMYEELSPDHSVLNGVTERKLKGSVKREIWL
ncbi:MAG: transposase [Ignavibacteria bacterium]|nr:transposase [Ignavibacteria bacterium]